MVVVHFEVTRVRDAGPVKPDRKMPPVQSLPWAEVYTEASPHTSSAADRRLVGQEMAYTVDLSHLARKGQCAQQSAATNDVGPRSAVNIQ